jgi:hypothetical protein
MIDIPFLDGLAAWTKDTDNKELAASCLKPFADGERLFFARHGRTEETERIFAAAEPREIKSPALLDYLTDEAAARLLLALNKEHLFREMTGYYEKYAKAQEALRQIDPSCGRNDWRIVGAALHHEFGPDGWFLWDTWSAKSKTKYDPRKIREEWAGFRSDHPNPAGLGTIIRMAKGAAHGA